MITVSTICPSLPFQNGADPVWSCGNSTIVRVGSRVFATNAKVHPERKPLNNTSLEIWEKEDAGCWTLVYEDRGVFQREPCPIAYLGENTLAVTANVPAAWHEPEEPTQDSECIPTLYLFDISGPLRKTASIPLPWPAGSHTFWEHSYRNFAVDNVRKQLFLDNIDYESDDRFCWTLLNHEMNCIKTGWLDFPQRVCYHHIAIRNGEVYLFGVQDIKEPNPEWHAHKRAVTGREWDYDFRKVYLNYCPDINSCDFEPSQLICERDATCGWTFPLDCCFDVNGDMLCLVSVQNVAYPFVREKFFPTLAPESALELYRFSKGRLTGRTRLAFSADTQAAQGYRAFFHTDRSGELFAVWAKCAEAPGDEYPVGTYLTRISDLSAQPVRLLDEPAAYTGSKIRLGAAPSDTVDLYWVRDEKEIMHGSFDLKEYR